MECPHLNIVAEACDQTLAVSCNDCNLRLAVCWQDRHIPETLWNRVCDSDPDCTRCEQNRENFCALCEEEITPKEAPPSELERANDCIWNARPSGW